MIALSRAAAGTWCGANQAGHVVALGATAGPSSSARAALATTPWAGASLALSGARATVRGSATGTSCSERIRGQRAAIGSIELEDVSDEIVGGLAATAAPGKLRPDGRAIGRHRQAAHHASIEAAEATAGRISDEARERGEPA